MVGGVQKAIETYGIKAYLQDENSGWKFAYIPYINNGIFSGYMKTKNDSLENIKEINLLLKSIMEDCCEVWTEDEILIARNNLQNDQVLQESSQEIAQEIANQYIYIGRRILRTEWATRVSQFADSNSLKVIGRKYFQSRKCSHSNWLSLSNKNIGEGDQRKNSKSILSKQLYPDSVLGGKRHKNSSTLKLKYY